MICPYDLSRRGGVQGQAVGLADALRRAGHEVLVVAPDDRRPGWVTGHAYVAGRSVGVAANGSVAPVALSPLAARRALGAVGEWGADVVHLHEPLAPLLGYGIVLRGGWPAVGTFHRAGVPRGAALVAGAASWMCRRIQVCVAVSEVARRSAAAWCGCTCEVLFNGVDLERFRTARPTPSARPAILFLGRHEPRKGLSVLLDAFARLVARGVDAELWVAGEGPETGELRARHPESERLHWLGVVSEAEAAERLAGAAALCAPSLGGESFGLVLLEAMAARCPVVASDIPGYRDAAAGHATLVAPGDPGALAAALEAVLSGPADPAALDAARVHASAWSIDRLAARYLDAYDRAGRLWRAGRSR